MEELLRMVQELQTLIVHVMQLVGLGAIVIYIVRHLIPQILSSRGDLSGLIFVFLKIVASIVALIYTPALFMEGLIEGYKMAMPKADELTNLVFEDLSLALEGQQRVYSVESLVTATPLPTATPALTVMPQSQNEPTSTPFSTPVYVAPASATPEPTLDLSIWNPATRAPTSIPGG